MYTMKFFFFRTAYINSSAIEIYANYAASKCKAACMQRVRVERGCDFGVACIFRYISAL